MTLRRLHRNQSLSPLLWASLHHTSPVQPIRTHKTWGMGGNQGKAETTAPPCTALPFSASLHTSPRGPPPTYSERRSCPFAHLLRQLGRNFLELIGERAISFLVILFHFFFCTFPSFPSFSSFPSPLYLLSPDFLAFFYYLETIRPVELHIQVYSRCRFLWI